MDKDVFDSEFILQLFKLSLSEKKYFEILQQNLKDEYLPEDNHRKLWKTIKSEVILSETHSLPKLPILKQQYRKDKDVLQILSDIKECDEINKDDVLQTLEDFIKQNMFVEMYNKMGDAYNRGNKNLAYSTFVSESNVFTNFSLKNKSIEKIFGDFNLRVVEREFEKIENKKRERIPTGIDELDHETNGGFETGEFVIIIGDSGSGKSFLGNHLGVHAARRGIQVYHAQAEGTRQQVVGRYDSCWSGTKYFDIKENNITGTKDTAIRKVLDNVSGEIHVEAFESFGQKTVLDLRNSIRSLKKQYDIKYVILDYMDLIDPGDGHSYKPSEERFRQQKVAKACKNIAVEENVVFVTFTQASSINPADLENPDFVITRFHLAEDKGKVRPADHLITINRTREEKKQNVCRLYQDKAREHSGGNIIYIAQNLKFSRFYDKKRTLQEFFKDNGE
jgi:KaiC/GvpD/RAD55 family RecA-like ATPase